MNPTTSAAGLLQRRPPADERVRCRVCTKWGVKLVPFVGGEPCPQLPCGLPDAIALVGGIYVGVDDGLPQYCCVFCIRQVEAAYRLRQTCKESDGKLREMFQMVEEVYVKVEEPQEMVEVKEEAVEQEEDYGGCNVEELVEDMLMEAVGIKVEEPVMVVEQDALEDSEDTLSADEVNEVDFDEIADKVAENSFEKILATGIRCCLCKKNFETMDKLVTHRDSKHVAKELPDDELAVWGRCDLCNKTIKNPEINLVKHKEKAKLDFRCKTCGKMYPRRILAIRHFAIMHKLNEVGQKICCACAESFKTTKELKEHSNKVHLPKRPPPDEARPFVCDICYHCYKTERLLYRHKLRVTESGQRFHCGECKRSFKYLHRLREHELTHQLNQCYMCFKVDPCPESLQKHTETHNLPDGMFKCLECGKPYLSPRTLRSHSIIKHGAEVQRCQHCSATFATDAMLTVHMNTYHLNANNFKCKKCPSTFINMSNLLKHMKFNHQKVLPFPCFFCKLSFSKKFGRRVHMEIRHPAEMLANPLPIDELYNDSNYYKPVAKKVNRAPVTQNPFG